MAAELRCVWTWLRWSLGAPRSTLFELPDRDFWIALKTSAKFSNAAACRNPEAGVLVPVPEFASKVRQRLTSLWTETMLKPSKRPVLNVDA